MEWRPIDTAPRDFDGENILLLSFTHPDDYGGNICVGFWGSAYGDRDSFWCDWGAGLTAEYDGHEEFEEVRHPTHWMPLPEQPAA